MEALVLAGGAASDDLQARGIARVPLLTVGGESLLARAVRCVREGGGAERIAVLAPSDVALPEGPGIERATHTGNLMDDLTAAVKGFTGRRLLVCTADMPLLSPEAVEAVMDVARQTAAEVVYPVVTRETMEAALPGSERTYRRLGGQTYTGGNLFYVDRAWLLRQESTIRTLVDKRKDPMALARFFGVGFALRVLAGSVTLAEVESFLAKKLGAVLLAPVMPYAELAADIDKAADLDSFKDVLDPLPLAPA